MELDILLTLEGTAEIGFGGYGQVFLAVLESSDSQIKVAVKQLRIVQRQEVRRRVAIVSLLSTLRLFNDPHWSNKRLVRELKVWAKAKHPNILELLGFYLSDDHLCARFVSAYMANGNVKEYIGRLQPDVATRLRFVQGITSGMSYLHSCNPAICHGDLKPTNVLVDESINAVLCDFGLARFILESGVSSGLTTSKTLKGSTRYMAPELLLEGETKHTLKTDVWAWACTAFEVIITVWTRSSCRITICTSSKVLTDCEPFPDTKREEAVVAAFVLGRPPGSVDLFDGLVSGNHLTHHLTLDSLKSIISNCWIRDSAKRPSSSEILDRLISADGIEALDTAIASSHPSAAEDRQPELLSPPSAGSPTHGNVKKKRRGSPGLEGRPEKRACGTDAAIETADGEVRIWNVPVPPAPLLDPVAIKHHPDSEDDCYIETMEWDCTGARLAIGCDHGVLRVWTAEGALQSNLKFHTDPISGSMWSPRALFLLSASSDGTVVVWDMRTRKKDKIYQVFRFHSGM
ncbi:hypothetical protein FRC04_001614 [Tulasnella sp. 424]|nr:hypothetical protein FRC04_001614 [Tulasnella sp. 424]